MLTLPAKVRRLRPSKRSRCKLPFPTENLRLAQISAGPKVASAQTFSRAQWDQLQAFRPSVLVGSGPDLQILARQVELGAIDLASVDRAIFVLTQCGHQTVSDVFRVVLWQVFGVPVYELLVGPEGVLIASECPAQEGWHIEPGVAFSLMAQQLMVDVSGTKGLPTGLTGRIEAELCPCGRKGMWLMDIEMLGSTSDERQLAATA